jgi:hypothetical protein
LRWSHGKRFYRAARARPRDRARGRG